MLFCGSLLAQERAVCTLDLNADCVADTVYSQLLQDGGRRMTRIVWGVRTPDNHCDTAWYADTALTFRSQTLISHPGLENVQVSVQPVLFNQDMAQDLLVMINAGTVGKQRGNGRKRDTTGVFCILAQRGFDTLSILPLGMVNGTKTKPIVLREIKENDGMAPQARSRRANASFHTLQRKNVQVDIGDGFESLAPPRGEPAAQEPVAATLSLVVVPNPVGDGYALIRAYDTGGSQLPASISVRDAVGRTVHSITLAPSTAGYWERPMDVSGLAAGVYSLILQLSDGRAATSAFIISGGQQ